MTYGQGSAQPPPWDQQPGQQPYPQQQPPPGYYGQPQQQPTPGYQAQQAYGPPGQVQPWQPPPGYGQQPYPPQGYYPPPVPAVQRKSPGTGVLLGIFIPGAGCMYADNVGVGIAILAMWLISIPLVFLLWIGVLTGFACWVTSMVLGYTMTQQWNAKRGLA